MCHARTLRTTLTIVMAMLLILAPIASSQNASDTTMPPVAPALSDTGTLTDAQIQTLVAPIALYPDPLIAQMLPAATYPLQIVMAERWLLANPRPTQASIDAQNMEPPIKAMLHYPTVLATMNDQLEWTQSLGVAFLNQQKEVMHAIQELRLQARNAGTLQSTPQQQVVMDGDFIQIQPVDPNVIYVPQYDPQTVYLGNDGTGASLTFGDGCPEGQWLDNDCDWYQGWVAGGGGWYPGWGRRFGHWGGGRRPGEGWPITKPWARNSAQPLPVRGRSPIPEAGRSGLRGYEDSRGRAAAPGAFQGYQGRAGVERAQGRAQESRPAPQARSAPRAAPAQAFRAQGNGRAVAAQSARGNSSRGGGGSGGGGGRGGGGRR